MSSVHGVPSARFEKQGGAIFCTSTHPSTTFFQRVAFPRNGEPQCGTFCTQSWRNKHRAGEYADFSLHVVKDGADDSADDAAFHGLPASFVRHVSFQGMR